MNAVLVEAGAVETCAPLTVGRALGECPVANRPLSSWQRERLESAGLELVTQGTQGDLYLRHDAWLSSAMIETLAAHKGAAAIRDSAGALLAWTGDSAQAVLGAATIPADPASFLIRYPWQFLTLQEQLLATVTASRIEGEVSPAATIEGTLVLGKGSRILPGVYIEGTVVVGTDCKIGPNCYLRGATAIGNKCHIGQAVEIKNSILMERASIGHLSYCGDSIIGCRVNFGAGTITANFRHDGKNHRSMVTGKLLDTGRRKFGTIMGDDVHTGIHTSIYPGRKLWPGVSTLPGAIVAHDLTVPA